MLRLILSWLCLAVMFTAVSAEDPKPTEKAPYVEFDFVSIPQGGMGKYEVQLTILTTDKDITFSEPLEFVRGTDPNTARDFVAVFLKNNNVKIEVVDKTKFRVYGYIHDGKLIPATKGKVESKDLKPEELPKVKNPPSA